MMNVWPTFGFGGSLCNLWSDPLLRKDDWSPWVSLTLCQSQPGHMLSFRPLLPLPARRAGSAFSLYHLPWQTCFSTTHSLRSRFCRLLEISDLNGENISRCHFGIFIEVKMIKWVWIFPHRTVAGNFKDRMIETTWPASLRTRSGSNS